MEHPSDSPDIALAATARLLMSPGLTHEEALVGLAAAIDGADPHALRSAIDDASIGLFAHVRSGLREQGRALAGLISGRLGLYADPSGHALAHRALADGRAHPLLVAAVGHELARHAGLHSMVAVGRTGCWTVLVSADAFLPVGYGDPAAVAADELQARCAHQVAHELLVAVAGEGPRAQAERADRLLPAVLFAGHPLSARCRRDL